MPRGFPVMKRDITFSAGERHLAGRIFWSPESSSRSAGVLFVHGLSSSQRRYERRANQTVAALGIRCLTFDLSGHGSSPGSLSDLTARDHLVDVTAACAQLAAELDNGRIGICGTSYGGYLAASVLTHCPVDRLLLRAPALYDDSLLDVPVDQRRGRSHGRAQAFLARLGAFRGEVLVLESEHDEVIPHDTITAYLEASSHGHHSMIPGAGHSLEKDEWDDVFVSEIIRWFEPYAAL